MPKPTIHVGLAIELDFTGVLPRMSRFAAIAREETFERVPSPENFEAFQTWLLSFRSTLVGITTIREFSALSGGMLQGIGKWPFGDRLIDINTWVAAKQNDTRLSRKWGKSFLRPDSKVPETLVELAQKRLWAVTRGLPADMPIAEIHQQKAPRRRDRYHATPPREEALRGVPAPEPVWTRQAIDAIQRMQIQATTQTPWQGALGQTTTT